MAGEETDTTDPRLDDVEEKIEEARDRREEDDEEVGEPIAGEGLETNPPL